MARIAVIPGSNREGSYNRQLAEVAVNALRALGAEADFIDLREFPLPIYDADLEAKGMPAEVRALRARLRQANGVILVSPEYNASVPPLLKNALDWVSRPDAGDKGPSTLNLKPLLLMSASPGRLGGLRAQSVWRLGLVNQGAYVLPDGVAVGSAHEAFGDGPSLKDAGLTKLMDEALADLVAAADRLER